MTIWNRYCHSGRAGGQKWVIIMSVAQAVVCYVAHFHAHSYKYSNKLLPQISQYLVLYFPLITMQRIYRGKDSYSCQIQVECGSHQHSNTHAIRSPGVLTFKISFCTQRLITFQNVFDNVDIHLLCRQEILEILCLVFQTSVHRMVHRGIIVLKETRLTTKCLNMTSI